MASKPLNFVITDKIEKISMAEGAGPSSGALDDAEKQFDAFEEEDEKDEGDTNLVLEDCNERIFQVLR